MLTLALQTRAVPAANEQPKDSTNTLPLKTQATESEHARAGGESEGESESAGAHARVCGVAGQGHQRKCPLCSASCEHSICTFKTPHSLLRLRTLLRETPDSATCFNGASWTVCAWGDAQGGSDAGATGAALCARTWESSEVHIAREEAARPHRETDTGTDIKSPDLPLPGSRGGPKGQNLLPGMSEFRGTPENMERILSNN